MQESCALVRLALIVGPSTRTVVTPARGSRIGAVRIVVLVGAPKRNHSRDEGRVRAGSVDGRLRIFVEDTATSRQGEEVGWLRSGRDGDIIEWRIGARKGWTGHDVILAC